MALMPDSDSANSARINVVLSVNGTNTITADSRMQAMTMVRRPPASSVSFFNSRSLSRPITILTGTAIAQGIAV